MVMFFVWLIVAFIALLIEMSGPGLFLFLSFFVGGCITALASLFTPSIYAQSLIFLASTVSALALIKLIGLKVKKRKVDTNIYALVDKKAIVIQAISAQEPGRVRVGGEVWYARSQQSINPGEQVKITGIKGAHLIVQKQIEETL